MKWLALIPLIILAGCVHNASNDQEPKIAGSHVEQASYTATAKEDSLEIEAQNQYGEWMIKTFYSLKQLGYNYKKTWLYIDSATKSIYNGAIPQWYASLKFQTDSSIRIRNIYKKQF